MLSKFLHKSPGGFRHENKYLLNRGVYEILKRRCTAVMKRDENSQGDGGYRVTTLYFDDVYRTAYKDKLGGFLKRKKFRIRVYNLSPGRISLEGKYKEDEYIRKKSALLTLDEYKAVLRGDYAFCLEKQSELLRHFYAEARITGLKPAVITDYFRDAFTAEAGNVRITFDRELSTGFGSHDVFEASYSPVCDFPDNVVLEIKYDRFIPAYIQEIFSGVPLMGEPVSKYVLCADKILEVNKICSH
ncbi:MAG: polyphosphate polymerase domain-containing protein [Oscillospiraceae bacterium]|nr:polyphosphate polymerase domain-containing protein [Oscillospiraceae bacterium]